MKLGVALGGQVHPWQELLQLVRDAEAFGFEAAYVDGDVSMRPSLGSQARGALPLHGWTTVVSLLAHTRRIGIGSIRLVHHWNAALLAQALASVEEMHPGRLHFLISIGAQPSDRRFGLDFLEVDERIRWLDENLIALRALWGGEVVSMEARHVQLDRAQVSAAAGREPLRIEIAARGRKLLDLVAAHADHWEINIPPVRARVGRAVGQLEAACAARGRDPAEIGRSMWLFTRLGQRAASSLEAEFRALNPWFSDLGSQELGEAIVAGSAAECRQRIQEIQQEHGLELPILDLTGFDADSTRRVMEELAPKA